MADKCFFIYSSVDHFISCSGTSHFKTNEKFLEGVQYGQYLQHFVKRRRFTEAAIIFGDTRLLCQKHNYYWRKFVFIQLIGSVKCLSKSVISDSARDAHFPMLKTAS